MRQCPGSSPGLGISVGKVLTWGLSLFEAKSLPCYHQSVIFLVAIRR